MEKKFRPADSKALNELVRASGVPFSENSISFIFACPRCNKDKKLYLRKTDGRFVCWVCKEVDGFQGQPEFALSELLNQSLGALRKILYGETEHQATLYLDVRLRDFFDDGDEIDPDADELVETQWPPDAYPLDHKFSTRGLTYLEGRGVSLDLAQRYGLRYCPPQRRVLLPVSIQGRLYGWQGRAVFETEYQDPETGEAFSTPKVTTLKGLKKELTLMFQDRLQGSEHAVLTEGPFDGLKADLCGGNVVTMGKAVSRMQIALLRNAGIKKLYLALDPDAASEIWRLTKEFSDLELFQMRAPKPFKDLGEMDCPGVHSLFVAAPRVNNAQIFGFVESDFQALDRRIIRHLNRPRRTR